MKTPLEMLHDIVAQISEGNTLLEMIYKNTEEMNEDTDCGLACLIRSFDKTRETAYAYIEELAKNEKAVSLPLRGNVDMSTIGKRINAARVSLGMSPEELENAVNLPSGFIAAWETGKAIPPSDVFDSLAKALETSVTWLLTGKEAEVSHE